MRVNDLLPDGVISRTNPEIMRLTLKAQDARPGDMFFALPSNAGRDIRPFIRTAIENGASCVVVPSNIELDEALEVLLIHEDPRALLSYAAGKFYQNKPENIVAVTGTNGKSSVVNFINQLWATKRILGASIGTLGIHINTENEYRNTGLTTPSIVTVHETLQALKSKGINHVALEASSHGLYQKRVDNLNICAAAFTNLSQDHLDYHKTFDAYFKAKALLFESALNQNGVAVINIDDQYGEQMLQVCNARGIDKIITIGKNTADIHILGITPHQHTQELVVRWFGKVYEIMFPLAGEFQVYNALTAAAIAAQTGLSDEEAIGGLESLRQIPGRLEFIAKSSSGGRIYIDYAHTPDALANALASLRPICKGKLHLVFGCGGDRDATKRPLMAKTANALADVITITDDNPRFESPDAIRAQLQAVSPQAINIGDRYKAIQSAIKNLGEEDILLVAGKGHETTQTYKDIAYEFDDRITVLELTGGA